MADVNIDQLPAYTADAFASTMKLAGNNGSHSNETQGITVFELTALIVDIPENVQVSGPTSRIIVRGRDGLQYEIPCKLIP